MSKAEAERLAAEREGTIVLLEPAPLDIPQTKFDESEGVTRRYFVLRDRPAIEQSDVESAMVWLSYLVLSRLNALEWWCGGHPAMFSAAAACAAATRAIGTR